MFLVVACVLAAIIFPMFARAPGGSRASCLSNVKQHALSAEMYAFDYDDHMPLAHNWYTALRDYRKAERMWCPVIQIEHKGALGYAYDSRLHGISEKAIVNIATQPMIFESTSLAVDTSDPFTSVPIPGRHNTRNCIGYADGHARMMPFPSAELESK